MGRWHLFAAVMVFYGGIVLWLGALLSFGFAVSAVPFEVLSRDSAGMVNRLILARLHVLELLGAVLLGMSLWMLNLRIRGWRWRVPVLLFVVMVTLFGVAVGLLEPIMNSIARSVSFDNPVPETAAAIARFEGYHRLYSALVGVIGLVGVTLFVWQTGLLVRLLRPEEGSPAGESAP